MPFIKLGESSSELARAKVPPLTAVHSSVLVTSRGILRECGAYERYLARLTPDARDALDATPSGVWAPLALARPHFEACDGIGLSEALQLDMGRRLASRLHSPFFQMCFRLAGAAGATPILLAAKAVKLWPQRNQGGDLLIVHTSPREARVELHGYSLADIPHVRLLWRGNLEGNARLVMPLARVTEVADARDHVTLVYRMVW